MNKLIQTVILAGSVLLLAACASKEMPEEPKGIAYKAGELVVRQCQDISDLELAKLFEEHEVTIRKQMSPHLYIVTWEDDDRSIAQVQHELKSTQMFCGVEKNLAQ
ncbi:MAG: hypothetical protein AUK35_06980 [Zetaproteobacteria bacterium CG2_30_46_52]|nr:MAG: hypothetical protein AUK35_06980 [Zetaproteobacteria bacterium CG2_30_46_52]